MSATSVAVAIFMRQGLQLSNVHTRDGITLVGGVSGLWIARLLLTPGDVRSVRALPFFIASSLVGTVVGRLCRFPGIDKAGARRGRRFTVSIGLLRLRW